MRILLSNDDGIDAPGIRALEEALTPLAEVWVVAPERERSAQSHALTLHKPLRVKPKGDRRFAISGTPADCVFLARHNLLPEPPDLVLSGVNRGANVSNDVHYSGTVAAAREAALAGLPSMAVSLQVDLKTRGWHHYATAAGLVAELLPRLLDLMPASGFLNLNVPDRPAHEVRGLKVAPLGRLVYPDGVDHRVDPWGRDYYWIGGGYGVFEDLPHTDGPLCTAGWATLTALLADTTHHEHLERLRGQLEP